ncbi:DUF4259 domain-containing protein [Hymenobacter taeanensis]|uniref:DUF4259 domain-containing protein n=1 Tax=Hymenobacter taeanensis TaxID=2735321 RepID=A0A6M6BLG1_9BACT|nr:MULTISPECIES: DUF4259 domain-containing protein [Hymenobacter]QJX48664.1 DUF4259 domain-containing protein [Hymenobacter taeanensis]UOQ81837.1 DUF4259 domain-containing protein [Hymenobacter sp. 5414T-23]
MATWGYHNFDNDAAADFSAKFRATHSLALLSEALAAADSSAPLEAEIAQEALAAAEIVAALVGKPGRDLPADLLPLTVQLTPAEAPSFKRMARAAVQTIAKQSALQQHWANSDDAQAWQELQKEVLERLQ